MSGPGEPGWGRPVLWLLVPWLVYLLGASVSLVWMDRALWVWQRVMSIPQMGKTKAVAQMALHPLTPTSNPACPLPTLAQLPKQT